MTPDGRRLGTSRITCSPAELRRDVPKAAKAGECPEVGRRLAAASAQIGGFADAHVRWHWGAEEVAKQLSLAEDGPPELFLALR